MIGKADWFTRRKYLGWGLHPKTWQGWVYVLVFILLVIIVQILPITINAKLITTMVLVAILLFDVIHIMIVMKKDEREKKHEAVADRNALWVLLLVLIVGLLYQTITSALKGLTPQVDYFLVAAILGAVIAKGLTNYYLDKRD